MIESRESFAIALGRLSVAAYTARRLPRKVLRSGYTRFECVEFDLFSGDEFWNLLCRLAAAAADASISCVVLDPDPIDYYFSQFNMYGALTLGTDASADEYFDSLSVSPPTSPADSLLYNSEVITWFSPSLEWLIWGERSLGIALIGVGGGFSAPIRPLAEAAGIPLLSLGDAASGLVSANFPGREMPSGWEDEFLASYSST